MATVASQTCLDSLHVGGGALTSTSKALEQHFGTSLGGSVACEAGAAAHLPDSEAAAC